jgi:hypothetical protein
MSSVTLVFPSSMTQSQTFTRSAKARGDRVVAASSVTADETAIYYDHWVYLPSMYDADFGQALVSLIAAENITHFYTPHMVIFLAVKALVESQAIPVMLCESPVKTLQSHYLEVFSHVSDASPFIEAISGKSPPASLIRSLFHYGEQIYGQTSETKIAAMAAVCADAPKGDVIEIGSAWGRSAFVLATLATHYNIGNVLCIDPWKYDISQYETDPGFVTATNDAMDWGLTFDIFCVHLMPFGGGRLNYLRGLAENLIETYLANSILSSPEFGRTDYRRRASVIHIDGNHGLEAIERDCRLWSPTLVPGGWLIIDDYVWAHGTGPQVVGDQLLSSQASNIKCSFCAGKALFIKFCDAPTGTG